MLEPAIDLCGGVERCPVTVCYFRPRELTVGAEKRIRRMEHNRPITWRRTVNDLPTPLDDLGEIHLVYESLPIRETWHFEILSRRLDRLPRMKSRTPGGVQLIKRPVTRFKPASEPNQSFQVERNVFLSWCRLWTDVVKCDLLPDIPTYQVIVRSESLS